MPNLELLFANSPRLIRKLHRDTLVHMRKAGQVWMLIAGLFCVEVGVAAQAGGVRPNILFIYTDDQRYDAVSVVQQELAGKGRNEELRASPLPELGSVGQS